MCSEILWTNNKIHFSFERITKTLEKQFLYFSFFSFCLLLAFFFWNPLYYSIFLSSSSQDSYSSCHFVWRNIFPLLLLLLRIRWVFKSSTFSSFLDLCRLYYYDQITDLVSLGYESPVMVKSCENSLSRNRTKGKLESCLIHILLGQANIIIALNSYIHQSCDHLMGDHWRF